MNDTTVDDESTTYRTPSRHVLVPAALASVILLMLVGGVLGFGYRARSRRSAVRDLNRRANALAAEGAFDEALAVLARAEAVDTSAAPTHYNRGRIHHLRGEWRAALAAYDRAIELRPDYVKALVNRAILHVKAGERSLALSGLDRALSVDAASTAALYHRARLRAERGDSASARSDLEQLLRLDPEDDAARALLRGLTSGGVNAPTGGGTPP